SVISCRSSRRRHPIHPRRRLDFPPSTRASRRLIASLFPFPAVLPDQTHRFVNNFSGDVERRTKTDRPITRAQRQNAKIKKSFPKSLTRIGIRQIERQHQSAAAQRRNGPLATPQLEAQIQEE